jgi:hypothetical protein
MEKIKACLAKSLSGEEPTNEEVADALVEGLDIVASIANSLERIAVAQEHIAAGA